MKRLISFFCLLVILAFHQYLHAQDKKSSVSITSDIVSRYIWRGNDYGASPAFQPTLSYSYSNLFEIGTWGSINTKGTYTEVDPYLKFSRYRISFILTDYFIYSDTCSTRHSYFDYSKTNTNHTFEAALQYKGPDKFPLSILAGTFLYGNDRDWGCNPDKDSTLENYYSTYLELGYTLKFQKYSFDLFLGGTPFAGAYGNSAGIVNIGISGNKKIPVTSDFVIPVKLSLILNPQTERIYFVFGFTL